MALATKKFVVRCKSTGVFYKSHYEAGTKFVTMDVNNATPFTDTEELKKWFTRNFPFELEFIQHPAQKQ